MGAVAALRDCLFTNEAAMKNRGSRAESATTVLLDVPTVLQAAEALQAVILLLRTPRGSMQAPRHAGDARTCMRPDGL